MDSIKIKDVLKIISLPVIVASLCCLVPVILVLFGLGTVSFAASMSEVLYGQYKWLFRLVGLVLLGLSVFYYLCKHEGICTIDDYIKRRNQVINIIFIVLIAGVVGYIIWLYVVVEIIGMLLGIWG